MNDAMTQDHAFRSRLDDFADDLEKSERSGALQSEEACRDVARTLIATLYRDEYADCEAEYRRQLAASPSRLLRSLLQNGLNLLLSGSQGDKARLFIALRGVVDALASAQVDNNHAKDDLSERPSDNDWTPVLQCVPLLSGNAVYIALPDCESGVYVTVGTGKKRFVSRAECQSGVCLAAHDGNAVTLTREDDTQTRVFLLEDGMDGLRVRVYLALGVARIPAVLVPVRFRVGRPLSLRLWGVDRVPPLRIEAGVGYLGPWRTLLTTQARTLGARSLNLSVGACPSACRCLRILPATYDCATGVRLLKF